MVYLNKDDSVWRDFSPSARDALKKLAENS
jgi:hypothetical protein